VEDECRYPNGVKAPTASGTPKPLAKVAPRLISSSSLAQSLGHRWATSGLLDEHTVVDAGLESRNLTRKARVPCVILGSTVVVSGNSCMRQYCNQLWNIRRFEAGARSQEQCHKPTSDRYRLQKDRILQLPVSRTLFMSMHLAEQKLVQSSEVD
jgi:hypothetical protein